MAEEQVPDAFRKLVERVNELARQVRDLDGLTGDVKVAAEHHGGIVTELAGQVEALGERLAKVEEALEDKRPKPQPDWLLVDDTAEALKWLDSLRAWVASVFEVHTGRELPECWIWHPRAVEELLALQAHRTYVMGGQNPLNVSDYRTRFLDAAVKRLLAKTQSSRGVLVKCVEDGGHVEPVYGRCKVDLGALHAYVEWWTTDRKGRPPGLLAG